MRKLLRLTALLTFFAFPVSAQNLLNGMSVHQELGQDQFIGALYTNTLTDNASDLMASDTPMRMEMKITSDTGLTARRFSRLWVEGMAINVRADTLTAQADNMVAFTNLFRGRLNKDDHVVFALAPNEGVNIHVNGIALGTIADAEFFSLLLSTWVGNVPLSSTFREEILAAGNVDSGVIGRFESISPSQSRINRIASWIAPEPEPEPEPAPAPAPAPTAEPPAIADATESERPRMDIQMPSVRDSLDENTSATPAPSSPSPTAPESAAPATPPAPEPEPEVAVREAPISDEDEDDEEALPAFTAESLLANQRYFSNLNLLIRRNLEYPRRSVQRGQEGNMRIAVELDRNGNLLRAEFLEESSHSLLNRAAMNTIERLAPFPPIPASISGNRHEFTIPITFELADG